MPVVTCVDDLREMAKKRVARAVFEYVDCGSYAQQTIRANRQDLDLLSFRQRVGVDVHTRSTRTSMAGFDVTLPVALAPVGLTGLNWADGEMLEVSGETGWANIRGETWKVRTADQLTRGQRIRVVDVDGALPRVAALEGE